jgi:small-conductance mechanosensitive channel
MISPFNPYVAQSSSLVTLLAADEETTNGIQRFFTRPVIAIAIVVGCFVLTRITYAILRAVVRKVADSKPGRGKSWWKNTVRRVGAETIEGGENRRRQRIEAATGMLHQLTSFVLWIIATIAVFNVLELDAAFFLSSAGFLGAALAIGGQHRVSDYLTGLAILLEDRYGVGDEIEASIGWDKPIRATVEHVGVITTRLRDGNSTFHVPHSRLEAVRNLSQEPVRESLACTKGLTTVLFIDEIQAAGEGDRVEVNVRTTRPLTETERELLAQKTAEALADKK